MLLAAQVQGLRRELGAALAKLVETEEAAESALTCMPCMQLLRDPVAVVPCGHVVCRGCCTDQSNHRGGGACAECARPAIQ